LVTYLNGINWRDWNERTSTGSEEEFFVPQEFMGQEEDFKIKFNLEFSIPQEQDFESNLTN